MVDNKIVQKNGVWMVMNGGQGEIYLRTDSIETDLIDFLEEFNEWVSVMFPGRMIKTAIRIEQGDAKS